MKVLVHKNKRLWPEEEKVKLYQLCKGEPLLSEVYEQFPHRSEGQLHHQIFMMGFHRREGRVRYSKE